ncbi:MAG: endonuclease [Marmoricola sp.]|nr:endonuclease [Marmoricola sp.]
MAQTLLTRNLPLAPRRRKPARTLEEAAVLAAARAAQAEVQAADARKLAAGVAWAALHEVDDPDLAATWGDTPITLAGPGAPLIAHSCVAEFASVIGTSTNGGRAYLADAIELAHRLPLVYALVVAGKLPAWRGRRIAGETTLLPADAVAVLDAQLAPLVTRLSMTKTQKMIDQAVADFLPHLAQQLADAYTDHKVIVDHRQVSFQGTSTIYGALDLVDAQDLDAALNREAEALAQAGCEASLDVRRSMAMGRLARGETDGSTAARAVTLYVHLPAEATSTTALPTAVIENTGPHLLTQAQIATWCGNPDVKVIVKPVIDLNQPLSTAGYLVPERLKEHLNLRDRTCVFPHCNKPARACQEDHIKAYDPHGPPNQTNTDNLASLCQHHHNLKTHHGWSYTMLEPGTFLWRSPHGYHYLRDHIGTTDLTPPPVPGPG